MLTPKLRLMARPMVSPLVVYHTRAGPRGMVTGPFALCPTTSCRDPTWPPAASTRRRSSGRSGLWSEVNITAATAPWCLRPSTARESPRLPTFQGGRSNREQEEMKGCIYRERSTQSTHERGRQKQSPFRSTYTKPPPTETMSSVPTNLVQVQVL